MTGPLSIAVLVSSGRNPVTGAPRACRGDAIALAVARQLSADRVRVLHAGDPTDPSLPHYVALGAGRIEVIPCPPGADICRPLAAELAGAELILTSCRAEAGAASGLLPYLLARELGRPIVTGALALQPTDRGLAVTQFLPKGARRMLAVPLPAVVAIHDRAPAKLTYAYARHATGAIIERSRPEEKADEAAPAYVTSPARRPLVRLKAEERRSGHARMLAAVAADQKRGVVVNEGTDVDKAQVVLDYLRQHHLVDF